MLISETMLSKHNAMERSGNGGKTLKRKEEQPTPTVKWANFACFYVFNCGKYGKSELKLPHRWL